MASYGQSWNTNEELGTAFGGYPGAMHHPMRGSAWMAMGGERPGGPAHVWRGGVFGWLGSGLRAAAAWTGVQMQRWGSIMGGKLSSGAEEVGAQIRAGGERAGMALEESGEARRMARLPRAYRRPDERVLDDVYGRVAASGADAEQVEIEVNDGVVKLSGSVPSRLDKRLIEDMAEGVFGVREVQNLLKLARRLEGRGAPGAGGQAGAGGQEPPWMEKHNGPEKARQEGRP